MIRFCFVFVLTVFVISCSDDLDTINVKDDASVKSLNGTWKVLSFEDYDNNEVTYPNEENLWGLSIEITFDDTNEPNEFNGRNASNLIFGKFQYIGKRSFNIESMGTTYVNQPELADLFTQALLDDNVRYEINSGYLRIFFDDETQSVTLERQ